MVLECKEVYTKSLESGYVEIHPSDMIRGDIPIEVVWFLE
jgi:hypothetical protein